MMERYDPKHVCAILDMVYCGVAGGPIELSVDLLWERMPNLVNFKNACRERVNGPVDAEAVFRTHWTTGRHGAYSWASLVEEPDLAYKTVRILLDNADEDVRTVLAN